MIKKTLTIFAGLMLILACDMHDHHSDVKTMPGVVMPKHDKSQCIVACHKNQGEDVVIAGYYAVEGAYKEEECNPTGYTEHLSEPDSPYTKKCVELGNCKDGKCWADANTGHKHSH